MILSNSMNIILKRFLSRIIDILIPFTIGGIAYIIAIRTQSPAVNISSIVSLNTFLWFSYLLIIIIEIIYTKGKTFGNIFLKIKPINLNRSNVTLFKIIFREVYIAMMLFLLLHYNFGWICFVINFIPIKGYKDIDHIIFISDIGLKSTYIANS